MVFRQNAGATFNDTWYRVADTRPRLSPHVEIVPQRFREDVRYVVEDAAGGSYFHLTESAYVFAGLLDGRRSVQDAWDACNAQFGDDAPTQGEAIELLGQLQLQGFLLGDQPVAADLLAERRAMFRKSRIKKRTGNYLFLHIPVINPEPLLERAKHLFRPLFSWWGLVVWSVLVMAATVVVLSNLGRLGSEFNGVLAPSNLFWLWLGLIVVRAVHEAGHAVACKAVGARCVEIGIMLVAIVLPLPYCDATSAWKLPRARDRAVVSLGGILFEGVLAALAVFYWAFAEPGVGRTVAFNLMVVSGVSSVVFNLNPLLRYDGYYLLADLARSPNLAQRARSVWIYLIERFGFGVRSARAPYVRGKGEASLLITYQALAVPYRLLVLAAILGIVSEQYLTIGVVLAGVFLVIWVVVPVVKFLWYMGTSPKLLTTRLRAAGVVAAVALPLALIIGVVPMPAGGFATGTIRPAQVESIRVGAAGFIDRIDAFAGRRVEPGDVLVEMSNPALEADIAKARAALERERVAFDDAVSRDPVRESLARVAVEKAVKDLERLLDEERRLTVRATIGGVVAVPDGYGLDPQRLVGRFAQKGDRVAVVQGDGLVVRLSMDDREHARVFGRGRVVEGAAIRVRGDAGRLVPAKVDLVDAVGTRRVDDEVLTAQAGGELLTDPSDARQLIKPHFRVDVVPVDGAPIGPSGVRARVRFDLPPEPVLPRVVRAVRRYLDGRVAG